jgi:hypothetical protein
VLIVGVSGATPNGGLYKIESITAEEAGWSLVDGQPRSAEAFEDLKLELSTVLDEPTSTSLDPQQRTHRLRPLGAHIAQSREELGLSFPISFGTSSGDDYVGVDGALSIDSAFTFDLEFDWESFELDQLSLGLSAEQGFNANLVGHGEALLEESATLGSISFAPITIVIPIPVSPFTLQWCSTPGVSIDAGVVGGVQGDIEAGVTQGSSFSAEVGYVGGEFGARSDDDSSFNFDQPILSAKREPESVGRPRLELLIYGAVGPYVSAEAFVELSASAEGPPPCARGSLDAGLARTRDSILRRLQTQVFDERYPLAKFDSCSEDADPPRPATTWARNFGRADSPGEQAKAIVEAQDGSFLVVGDSSSFDGITGFAASMWALRLDPLGKSCAASHRAPRAVRLGARRRRGAGGLSGRRHERRDQAR